MNLGLDSDSKLAVEVIQARVVAVLRVRIHPIDDRLLLLVSDLFWLWFLPPRKVVNQVSVHPRHVTPDLNRLLCNLGIDIVNQLSPSGFLEIASIDSSEKDS